MNEKKQSIMIKNVAAAVVSISSFLAIWQLGVSYTRIGRIVPGPFAVLAAFFSSFTNPVGVHTMFAHILFSLSRVLVAYSAACVIGITLGLLMARVRLVEAIFRPFYEIIRPIPPLAWISMSILWFGLSGDMTKYFIIFIGVFPIITYTTFSGCRRVDPTLIMAAKMLGANDAQAFITIIIPASVPYIFSGMQLALSGGWACVVAAEMIRSSEGVGWIIVSGSEMNNMLQILYGIVAIGVVGYLLVTILRKIEAVLCSWNVGGV